MKKFTDDRSIGELHPPDRAVNVDLSPKGNHHSREISPELLTALQSGDHKAFYALYMRYADSLVEFLSKLLRSREEAKEITQEVFAYIWERHEDITSDMKFRSYMYSMARNMALNLLRHKKVERKYYDEEVRTPQDFGITAEEILSSKEFRNVIEIALNGMPPQRRKVFELSRYEGKTHDEIAAMLGISPTTVRKHIQLALRELRELMALMAFLFL